MIKSLQEFFDGMGKPNSLKQGETLFNEFKQAVEAVVKTPANWLNDADFSMGTDMETYDELSFEEALNLVGGDEDEFDQRFDFGAEWEGVWAMFGEGKSNSIKLGLDDDGGPCIDVRGIFSPESKLTVRFMGLDLDGDKFQQLLQDLENKAISGPQPGQKGSIYAPGDFG